MFSSFDTAMYAQKKSIENAHIVRERDRRRFRELLAVLSLSVPVALFLLLFTWQNLEVIRLGREATRLRTERQQLEAANKRLRVEIEQLTALDQVEAKAAKMGLVPATLEELVVARSVAPEADLVPRSRPTAVSPSPIQEDEMTSVAADPQDEESGAGR